MADRIQEGVSSWASGRRGDYSFVQNGRLFFLPRLVWVLLAFATLAIPSPTAALVAVGALSVGWTVIIVQRRGGPYLTPSGVLFLACGVFVGVSCWYLVSLGSDTDPQQLRFTAVIVFSLTVAIEVVAACFSVRWGTTWSVPLKSDIERTDYWPPRHFALKGALLVLVSRVPAIISLNYELANAIGLAGVLIVVLNAVSLRRRIRWGGDLVILAVGAAIPMFWVQAVFRGGGRLTVAGLGIAVLMTWNLVKPSGWQKLAVLLAIPVFLVYAGHNRLDKIEKDYGVTEQASSGQVISSGKGLESVYDPLDKFATIVLNPDYPSGKSIGPRYGATFVNTLLMPVPRSMWKGKPKGFGAEITEVMRPDLVKINQSFAALSFAEWYADFGWPGVFAMPVAFGWILAKLDRMHARLAVGRLGTAEDWWKTLVLLCIVASLGELYWAGTFIFYTRGGMAALVSLAVYRLSAVRLAGGGLRPPAFMVRAQHTTPDEPRVEAGAGARGGR